MFPDSASGASSGHGCCECDHLSPEGRGSFRAARPAAPSYRGPAAPAHPQRTQPSSLSLPRGATRAEGSLNRGELVLPLFIRQRHRTKSGIGMAPEGEGATTKDTGELGRPRAARVEIPIPGSRRLHGGGFPVSAVCGAVDKKGLVCAAGRGPDLLHWLECGVGGCGRWWTDGSRHGLVSPRNLKWRTCERSFRDLQAFLPTRAVAVELACRCLLSCLRIYTTCVPVVSPPVSGGECAGGVGSGEGGCRGQLPLTCKRQNSTGMFHPGPLQVPTSVHTDHVFFGQPTQADACCIIPASLAHTSGLATCNYCVHIPGEA